MVRLDPLVHRDTDSEYHDCLACIETDEKYSREILVVKNEQDLSDVPEQVDLTNRND